MKTSIHNSARRVPISFLAALSGACGLVYEILFIRLFSNYFGDSFVITGVTLCAVFLGMSFGAWRSLRFIRYLAAIEIIIGIYAFVAATVFSAWGFEIAAFMAHPWINAAKLTLLLGVPAFLIGTCVPLFSVYAREAQSNGARTFSRIYGFYNLGAFASVLAIEFLLFRLLGLQATSYVIGCLNLLIGGLLLVWHRPPASAPLPLALSWLQWRVALPLFLGSFASGVFQLFVLRLSFSIFGPLHENFAIILASAIAGVAIGSWLSLRRAIRFADSFFWLALFTLVFLISVPLLIDLWSSVASFEPSDFGEVMIKALLLSGFPLPLFVCFGALVPLAISAHGRDDNGLAGTLLAISSLGNGLGSLVMFMILYRTLTLPQIGIASVVLLLGAGFVALNSRPAYFKVFGGCVIAVTMGFAGFQSWPKVELLLGYRALLHGEEVAHRKRLYEDAIVYQAYDQNAALVRFSDQSSSLVLNGYKSLGFGPHSKAELHEVIVGATPILFGKETGRALVFGLGSGITGGSTARFYDHTKIVEINPAMLHMPKHFTHENQNVMQRPNVDVVLEDGISTLLTQTQEYDAIINTVTSPQYFSAAKLYTQDFYDIVRSRLSPGGVYSSWFDVNIDREGISIMLNTLEASFKHCRYFLLTSGYFNVACSEAPLIYHSSPETSARVKGSGVDELFARFGLGAGFQATMAALEISFEPRFMERSSDLLNTLDHPAIEFVVARERDASDTIAALGELIANNIEFQRQTAFGSQKWRSNCRIISRMSGLEFRGC